MLEPPETPLLCCTQCWHQTVWPFQLDHHIQRHHRNVYAPDFDVSLELEQYTCVCGRDSKTYSKLDRYEHCVRKRNLGRAVNANIENRCDYCKYQGHSILYHCKHHSSYRTVSRITKARPRPLSKSRSQSVNKSGRVFTKNFEKSKKPRHNWFLCNQCPHQANNKGNLKRHLMTHVADAEINWFYCTDCTYRAKRKGHLKTHMLRHAGPDLINWLACTKCPHRAKFKGDLDRHMLTHAAAEEINWFTCTKCPYRARQKGNLKRHSLMHAADEEISWFHCNVCPYKAKMKKNLETHMLTHAVPDDFIWFDCPQCSYRAKQKQVLDKHLLTHASADETPWFDCAECCYRTKIKSNLRRHILTHGAPEEITFRFSCTECSYQGKGRKDFGRHMLTHPEWWISFPRTKPRRNEERKLTEISELGGLMGDGEQPALVKIETVEVDEKTGVF